MLGRSGSDQSRDSQSGRLGQLINQESGERDVDVPRSRVMRSISRWVGATAATATVEGPIETMISVQPSRGQSCGLTALIRNRKRRIGHLPWRRRRSAVAPRDPEWIPIKARWRNSHQIQVNHVFSQLWALWVCILLQFARTQSTITVLMG
jgi:hypothetical protein